MNEDWVIEAPDRVEGQTLCNFERVRYVRNDICIRMKGHDGEHDWRPGT